jgi:cell division septal protein FtsQ
VLVRPTLTVALPAAVALGALAVAWPYAARAVRRHPYFAVREVLVRQAHRVRADEIRRTAGIEPGISIWDVDAETAETRLRAHDWIRAARVRRELPHG